MTRRALLVFCLLPAAFAQRLTAPADARARIDAVFARFNHTDTPGCAVGVSLAGDTVASLAYGMADLEHDVPLRPDSIFEPGSVTKQFTAAAVLLLAEQGKLSLDDPARKYLPELPDYGTPLTIRHLLNHTSGLRDWGSLEAIAGWPRTTRAYTHDHVLDILSRQRALNYPPGAEYSYTNSGYNLAAILVGRVSGKPLAEFTRDAIFQPLGMTSTSWRDDYRRIVKGRAIAYSQNGAALRQLMPFEDVHGNGGLLTTVADLLRWNQKFTLAHQLDRPTLTDGRTIRYAAGLMVLRYKGLDEISHSGTTAGYNAWLGRYPAQQLSVAVLCNSSAANGTQLGHAVADTYLGDLAKAAPPAPLHLTTPGLYRSLRDSSLTKWMAVPGTSASSRGRPLPPNSRPSPANTPATKSNSPSVSPSKTASSSSAAAPPTSSPSRPPTRTPSALRSAPYASSAPPANSRSASPASGTSASTNPNKKGRTRPSPSRSVSACHDSVQGFT
jgi:CubicO group peptidase (beta-lactamase class C family)